MSAFSDSALLKKLGELNSSQQSIQTLSLWLIHHRKHHASIVKTWFKELQSAVSEGKKLTFMYLANDVIQNSKKKGPEYGKEFSHILPKVFTHIGESCTSEKLFGSLGRILNIWEERGVYDSKQINEYRGRLNKEIKDRADASSSGTSSEPNTNGSQGGGSKEKSEKREKRKHEEGKPSKVKRSRPQGVVEEKPSAGQNGDAGHLSPYLPLGDPPEPEELIKALANIENSASSDAVVRERIANLPPEISEIGCLSKLEDKDAAKALAKQVNEAVQLLNEYNARLAAEMEERTKLASMLRDFQAEQKELLVQAEKRLDEYKQKLNRMVAVQKEIRDHLSNLPDLTQLPDVTGGLAPLPSAGDLFNIH
ncbi:regulation of nuclear pre-mRNA domain-containing protein 1B-like [Rhagoletis pomonella]|uniref:regulation of nuclear pre-mRNA domain-containing protein 1B-like n=1 Tax=Rhagoletis pomonella TaxID=28610 RepID=UPI001781FDEE|nr:regulation of nuclear pre-mRNA domain-containing protein 1B-like [Rhagoletis pomonella]